MYIQLLLPLILLSPYLPGGLCAALVVRSNLHTNVVDGHPRRVEPPIPITALSKRVVVQDGMGFGWLAAWEYVEEILPIEDAARGLETLYSTVIDSARGQLSTTVPQHTFASSIGNIHLLMYCERRPIPWQFIATFAERALTFAQNGQPSLYRIKFYHPNARTVVRILWLKAYRSVFQLE